LLFAQQQLPLWFAFSSSIDPKSKQINGCLEDEQDCLYIRYYLCRNSASLVLKRVVRQMPPHVHAVVPVEHWSVNSKSEKAGKKTTCSELSAIFKVSSYFW
jgi:hypothetical protein